MMHMEQRQTQSLSQSLVLTLKMQQALQVLQMSTHELEQHIQQELETNPFLDQAARAETAPPPAAADAASPSDDNTAFDESFDLDRFSERVGKDDQAAGLALGEAHDSAPASAPAAETAEAAEPEWWEQRHREGQDLSYNPDLADRQRFYEESITQEQSLRAHLLSQMRLAANEASAAYRIGERIIIGDIDARGYFTGSAAEIAAELGAAEAEVDAVLRTIRGFEPTGVGARDVVECLLLQIDAECPGDAALRTLVAEHFDALVQRQIPRIAKAMKIAPEAVEALRARLSALDPWPGRRFASEPTPYVAAEVVVEKVDGEYVVRLAGESLPEVRLNLEYQQQIKNKAMAKGDRDFLREKLEAARWLQRNISQRQETILKVSQAIVDVQRDFMEKGVEHIKPLTLQIIATAVGIDESTVSRTTRGKYMQTPQGIFELKYFFSPGLARSDGDDAQSSKSVQAQVRKIVDEEDKRRPLSDQKIADMLNAEGLNIARRTVTKYREALGIPSTTMRRTY